MPPQPRIICLTNGIFQENCYLVASPDDPDAVLIDPGEEADLFLSRLEAVVRPRRRTGALLGIHSTRVLPPPDRELIHGGRLSVGSCTFEILHVPGHSPGGVAFVGDGLVFSGDALFAGSIGRSDLPGGDMQQLLASIHQQLLSLPDETVVYPGHGPQTTIGAERSANPFLRL